MSGDSQNGAASSNFAPRSQSPGPSLDRPEDAVSGSNDYIKLSFRAGGEKIFHERLKGAMIQRKWLLQNAPPVPNSQQTMTFPSSTKAPQAQRAVGIAGLERLGLERRRNNETVISSAFSDLEALMTSAKEIIALAESFAATSPDLSATTLLQTSAAALGMPTTKDMLGTSSSSDSLYLSELARNLAEYLTDDRQGVLRKAGGVISLVDLWATLNRARNGVELVSASDFVKAARLWEKLSLPVRLREFKNGLLVVQSHDWTDEKTIAQLLAWFQELRRGGPGLQLRSDGNETGFELETRQVPWDWTMFGKGVTAQEAAGRFGWSVGVATEELEMAEERGVLCREEGVEGLRFWENWFMREEVSRAIDIR